MNMLALLILITTPALPDTLQVPGDHPTIQAAINASTGGDTVLVAAGSYVENIDFLGKSVVVTSESGPFFTTIDGGREGCVVRFDSNEGPGSVLKGFRITNGSGWEGQGGGIFCGESCSPKLMKNVIIGNAVVAAAGTARGGGIFCMYRASPAITESIIAGNRVEGAFDQGGGICVMEDCSPLIAGNLINGNEAHDLGAYGGAIYLWKNATPEIRNNTITGNTAQIGSAIYGTAGCKPVIMENTITGNTTNAPAYGTIHFSDGCVPTMVENLIQWNDTVGIRLSDSAGGLIEGNALLGNAGGIACHWSPGVTISGNTIAGNSGLGIRCHESSPAITGNVISGNACETDGGGIYIEYNSDPTIVDNVIADNMSKGSGGGIMVASFSTPLLLNNTITGNYARHGGGGIAFGFKSYKQAMANTILWGNGAEFADEVYLAAGGQTHLAIRHSNIQGGAASIVVDAGNTLYLAPSNIDADPRFADPSKRDFHLFFDSPCRNAGSNGEAGLPDLDFEGDPRIHLGVADIGADEFHPHLYLTGDATPGGLIHLKTVGLPGSSPVGLFIGAGVLDPPWQSPYGEWYLESPIIGPLLLPVIPGTGVFDWPISIPGNPPGPYQLPLQAYIEGVLSNLCIVEVE